MSNSPRQRDAAMSRAQTHFQKAEQRDALVRTELEKERIATATKTAKLKALRLAREIEDKEAADRAAAEKAAAKPASRLIKAKAAKTAPKVAAKTEA